MSLPGTPRWRAEPPELELPDIHENDNLGELVRKLSLCVALHSCSMLYYSVDAARGCMLRSPEMLLKYEPR